MKAVKKFFFAVNIEFHSWRNKEKPIVDNIFPVSVEHDRAAVFPKKKEDIVPGIFLERTVHISGALETVCAYAFDVLDHFVSISQKR
jgi:hypothetical protein